MFIEQISGQKIKIKFDINEKQPVIGDVLKITAAGKSGLLVQVIEISTAEKNPNFNIAESKILFTIDLKGKLTSWQGNIPSQDFIISKLSAQEMMLCSKTLSPKNPIPVGISAIYPDEEISLEGDFFKKPTVVFADKQSQKDAIQTILACELSKTAGKTVLADFNDNYSEIKISTVVRAGKQTKLPLNYKVMEMLYENMLSDATPTTKATMEDIFLEIENYLTSGRVDFIPFNSFRKAVEAVYETNKTVELSLLKNRLAKFHKQGIFADKKQEIDSIWDNLYNNELLILDLSEFPNDWHKNLIQCLIDLNIDKFRKEFFLIVDISKLNPDREFIEHLCEKAPKSGIYPIIVAGHEDEISVSLLSYAENIIAFAPENTSKIASIRENLFRLKAHEAVITGKLTNNIPLYIDIYGDDTVTGGELFISINLADTPEEPIYLDSNDSHQNYSANSYLNEEEQDEDFNYSNQFSHDEEDIEKIGTISDLQEGIEPQAGEETEYEDYEDEYEDELYNEADEEEEAQEEYEEDQIENINSAQHSLYDDEEYTQSSDYGEDELDYYTEETPPLPPQQPSYHDDNASHASHSQKYASGFSEDDLSSFLDDDEPSSVPPQTPQATKADDDFDYSTNADFQDESMLDYSGFYDADTPEPAKPNQSENAFYDDFDEEGVYEEAPSYTNSLPSANIPVYDTPSSGQAQHEGDFAEGDKIKHAKYGIGTITKIIGTNDKKLCSIQFEDVGKRLLDPNLAGLEKI